MAHHFADNILFKPNSEPYTGSVLGLGEAHLRGELKRLLVALKPSHTLCKKNHVRAIRLDMSKNLREYAP